MNNDVNYISHHRNVYFKMSEDNRLSPYHLAVYNALFMLWNECAYANELSINRNDVMMLSKIGSANTYTKCLKDLNDYGYIIYKPSFNPLIGSKITIIRFDKGSDKGSVKGGSKATDKGADTLYKHINKETNKQVNKETIYTDVFDFKNELLKFGANESLVKDWLIVRKEKKASNTKTAFKGFITQVEKSGWHIDKVLDKCILKSWKGFEAEWVKDEVKQTETKYFKFYNHLLGKEVQEPIPEDLVLKYGYKYTWDYSLKKVCQIPA